MTRTATPEGSFGRRRFRPKRRAAIKAWVALFSTAWLALAGSGSATAQADGPFARQANAVAKQYDVVFRNYRFRDGATLAEARIHYATLGEPYRDQYGQVDNAILVLHWTGADSRALLTPEYVRALFDPGRPLDSSRYYLIFPDNIGHGRSSKPSDGLRAQFPNYGYGDIVDLQHKLVVETLGIKRLHAILGMSMGGMNAWQWAEAYPEALDGIMPVVSLPARISGRNLIWRRLALDYIRGDPDWNNGNYSKPFRGWIQAYQLLRMMIDGVPHLQAVVAEATAADTFLADAAALSAGGDANDVLYSLKASGDYDPEPRLDAIRIKVFALNFGEDEFNPDSLQILQTRIARVPQGRWVVQPGSPASFGHLTMAHPALWADKVAAFMQWLEGRGN